ncbi:MAG: hypothetical protein KI792_05500 [Alphaproteobacteria bacterium]|nr:hypothetical protein [Alphaproteobacteria bacterium SS10]
MELNMGSEGSTGTRLRDRIMSMGDSLGLGDETKARLDSGKSRAMMGHQGSMIDMTQHEGRAAGNIEKDINKEAGQTAINVAKMAAVVPGGQPVAAAAVVIDKVVPDSVKEKLGEVARKQPGIQIAEKLMGGDPQTKMQAYRGARQVSDVGATVTNPQAGLAGGMKPSMPGLGGKS